MKSKMFIYFAIMMMTAFFVTELSAQTDAGSSSKSGYHLLKKLEVGGEGGWDYLILDNASKRLFIARSTHADVVDAESGKKLGEVSGTNGIHGIALDENGFGYASNGRDSSVTVFDLKTLKEVTKLSVGQNPDAIIYDAFSKRVFAFNRRSSSVSAIDCATKTVAGTLALGGHPEFSVSDGKGMMYVNLDDKSEIAAFDAVKLEIKGRWSVAPGEKPSGLAMDTKNRRLFSVCDNKKMIVMNADNGKVIADLPIGENTDGAAFDSKTGFAFSANGEGNITVVKGEGDKYSVVENIVSQSNARTVAIDGSTGNIYLPTAQYGPKPEATADNPKPKAKMIKDSFVVLVFGK